MPAKHVALLAVAAAAAAPALAQSQDGKTLQVRGWAAACAACHGTDGRPAAGSSIPALAGMPKVLAIAQFNAVRTGTGRTTVMHQLAKGLTDEQIEALAGYFADQKP